MTMPEAAVDSIAALEEQIGKTPAPMHLKVIDHLDPGALRWIEKSPLLFVTVGDGREDGKEIAITLGGGEPGFVSATSAHLTLPTRFLDDPAIFQPGLGIGSLFPLPGIGETLRVNGRVVEVTADEIRIAVEECYGHCAKALIRSDFWSASQVAGPVADEAAFVSASRFLALATVDAQGRADLSPKGDPEGTMAQLIDGKLQFAERPGNRRADSLRNIIDQSRAAGLLLVPGSGQVLRFSGAARISGNEELRKAFAVNGKTPSLVTSVENLSTELYGSAALARAALWPVDPVEGVDAPALFLDHIKLNRNKGLGARMAGAILSMPGMQGMMRKGLEKDYKDNLY